MAARQAVDDALPLMAAGALATVLGVDQAARPDATAELTAVLKAVGVRATVKSTESRAAGVAETIIEGAEELTADLIVVGSYSRSPTVETWFGGVTRSLLATAPRPLLLSHLPDDVRRAIAADRDAGPAVQGPRPAFR